MEVDDDEIGQQCGAGRLREALAQQEIAIAVSDEQRNAGVGNAAQRCHDGRDERIGHLIVADPPVEQVAQDIDRGGSARGAGRKGIEGSERGRTLRRQVQIGQEERRRHSGNGVTGWGQVSAPIRCRLRLTRQPATSSAFRITTSSFGTFWWNPLLPVGTARILSTTSWPATTLPNTQ